MKTITTQPTQNPIDFPPTQPVIDPLIALLLSLSVLFPLINQNLNHLLQLLTTLQKLRKVWKRDCLTPTQKPKQ